MSPLTPDSTSATLHNTVRSQAMVCFLGSGSKKCQILYLVGQLRKGGCERQLCYLLKSIHRERYKPAVVVWSHGEEDAYGSEIRSLGIPLHCFQWNSPRHEKLMALRRLVKKLEPEVLHSYSFYTNFAAWWCTRGCSTIPLGSIRNNFLIDRRVTGKVLGRLSARWPADQICNSLAAKTEVEKCVSTFKPSRLHVVRNRLDINSFSAIAPLPSQPMLLAVGRLYPEKRWDRLVKVIASVRKTGMAFSVRHAGEGPLRAALEAQARQLGVDQVIEFLGLRHDVPRLLADSTFLLHTADEEGCPNVVMEAMACGRAVVATDAGDVRSLVDDGRTGFVVDRGNDNMLLERVVTLIENRDLCSSMGQAGRIKAEQDFRLNHLVNQTFQAYRDAGWAG